MEETVNYSRIVRSMGGHKSPRQSGLTLTQYSYYSKDVIQLGAINPKTGSSTTWLFLEIPREDLDKVIQALQNMR